MIKPVTCCPPCQDMHRQGHISIKFKLYLPPNTKPSLGPLRRGSCDEVQSFEDGLDSIVLCVPALTALLLSMLLFLKLPVPQDKSIQAAFGKGWTWHISRCNCEVMLNHTLESWTWVKRSSSPVTMSSRSWVEVTARCRLTVWERKKKPGFKGGWGLPSLITVKILNCWNRMLTYLWIPTL